MCAVLQYERSGAPYVPFAPLWSIEPLHHPSSLPHTHTHTHTHMFILPHLWGPSLILCHLTKLERELTAALKPTLNQLFEDAMTSLNCLHLGKKTPQCSLKFKLVLTQIQYRSTCRGHSRSTLPVSVSFEVLHPVFLLVHKAPEI